MTGLRLRGSGHPDIRATHANTFEFSTDQHIGPAATCVVAVGSGPVGQVPPVAGPVRLELTAGNHSAIVHAVGNPRWRPGGPAIVRRSDVRLPNTFATQADLAAADLPRELVAALADPATAVELTVTRRPRPGGMAGLVLLWGPASPDRLEVEADAATLVVSEDTGADRLLAALEVRAVHAGDGALESRVAATLDQGGRVLVVATDDEPGRTVVEHLGRGDTVVEVAGLPGPLAVAAATGSRAPLVLATSRGQDAVRALRGTPAGHRLVVRTPATGLDRLARAVTEHRGQGSGMVVARLPYELHERPVRLASSSLPASGELLCCVEPGTGAAGLGPAELRLAATLLADGVSTRTVARAVAELAGLPRREAYAAVLDLAHHRPPG